MLKKNADQSDNLEIKIKDLAKRLIEVHCYNQFRVLYDLVLIPPRYYEVSFDTEKNCDMILNLPLYLNKHLFNEFFSEKRHKRTDSHNIISKNEIIKNLDSVSSGMPNISIGDNGLELISSSKYEKAIYNMEMEGCNHDKIAHC